VFLVVEIVLVFWQVGNHDFVNDDDNRYITEKHHVQAGLTWEGITRAFTATHVGNLRAVAQIPFRLF
jgi:hypothetical protein